MSSASIKFCVECGGGRNTRGRRGWPTPWLCSLTCQHAREARLALGERQGCLVSTVVKVRRGHVVKYTGRHWHVIECEVLPGVKGSSETGRDQTRYDLRLRALNFDPKAAGIPVFADLDVGLSERPTP